MRYRAISSEGDIDWRGRRRVSCKGHGRYEKGPNKGPHCFGHHGKSERSGKDRGENGECQAGCLCECHPQYQVNLSVERKSCQIKGNAPDAEIHRASVPGTREGD